MHTLKTICLISALVTSISTAYAADPDTVSGATSTAAAYKASKKNQEGKTIHTGLAILVVYYSRTGNTRGVAQDLATRLGADIEELQDESNYKGFFGYMSASRKAMLGSKTKLGALSNDPADYDLVIVGTPIWAFTMAPAVRTYLDAHGKDVKAIACFTTSGSTHFTKVVPKMEKAAAKKSVASFGLREKEIQDTNKYEKQMGMFLNEIQNYASTMD